MEHVGSYLWMRSLREADRASSRGSLLLLVVWLVVVVVVVVYGPIALEEEEEGGNPRWEEEMEVDEEMGVDDMMILW